MILTVARAFRTQRSKSSGLHTPVNLASARSRTSCHRTGSHAKQLHATAPDTHPNLPEPALACDPVPLQVQPLIRERGRTGWRGWRRAGKRSRPRIPRRPTGRPCRSCSGHDGDQDDGPDRGSPDTVCRIGVQPAPHVRSSSVGRLPSCCRYVERETGPSLIHRQRPAKAITI